MLSEFAHSLKPPGALTHIRSRSEDSTLPVYNYSCQARNSTKHNMARLRQSLEAKKRYTLCQEFLFGAFNAVDPEEKDRAKK